MTQSITTLRPGLPDEYAPPDFDLNQLVRNSLAGLWDPERLTVIVNDPQRGTATNKVLAVLTEHMDPARIRILLATGSHKITTEQRRQFEAALTGGIQFSDITWHDAYSDDLVSIGGAWQGNAWLLGDAPLLAIGSVEPHYFAGFTGAHKTLTIGVASYDDIQSNHAAALSDKCRPGLLEGNPVYQGVTEMLAALAQRQRIAAINLVQIGSDIIFAHGSEPIESLRVCSEVAATISMRPIDSPADCVIAEVSGPLGESFYQADKGIKNNEHALRAGGTLVLVAPCPGGLGQDAFAQLLRQAPTCKQAAELVESQGYRLGDHKAFRLLHLTDPACRNVKLFIVSDGISADQAALLGATKAATVEDALAAANIDPTRDKVYHVLDAGNCCVFVNSLTREPVNS